MQRLRLCQMHEGRAVSNNELVVGYSVSNVGVETLAEDILKKDADGIGAEVACRWLACLNPHSFAVALDDLEFSRALHSAHWLIPDGAGVVLASKLLGGSISHRVTGSDIFHGVMSRLDSTVGNRVFFLGSTDDVLVEISERVRRDYPNVDLAGIYSPPFKPVFSRQDVDEMISAVNKANVDVLWVGMTAPKQEKWIFENRARLNVAFAGAIGAVFDFYAGRVRRSHPVFQACGLEWLPRLLQQPRRLWRRTFISAPVFLFHVLRNKFGG